MMIPDTGMLCLMDPPSTRLTKVRQVNLLAWLIMPRTASPVREWDQEIEHEVPHLQNGIKYAIRTELMYKNWIFFYLKHTVKHKIIIWFAWFDKTLTIC